MKQELDMESLKTQAETMSGQVVRDIALRMQLPGKEEGQHLSVPLIWTISNDFQKTFHVYS